MRVMGTTGRTISVFLLREEILQFFCVTLPDNMSLQFYLYHQRGLILGFILSFPFDPCLNKKHAYENIHQLLAFLISLSSGLWKTWKHFLEKAYKSIHIHIAPKNQSQWKGYRKYQEKNTSYLKHKEMWLQCVNFRTTIKSKVDCFKIECSFQVLPCSSLATSTSYFSYCKVIIPGIHDLRDVGFFFFWI